MNYHTKEELMEVLRVASSRIINCEKVQKKFSEETSHHTRFKNIIEAMYISKSLIMDEISKRD
ncbi:Uncharacterised protein [Clostridioides difficile]|uniref:Uncharacterized protein n=1 Tax=Clostridioides difficile TaxID=1496 RepID=A0AB74R0S8_CLODI|nr:hypothetical protein [Clostridioides difficile]OFU03172.1 hypothetical protein HMPREF3085_06660 [Clostridium sp. HMSC19E03]OFU03466.1 hypothetical protein HMPREF3083_12445 [Clostridium sp. HMSC19D07]OFU21898.1 hypothetical protein HMPREF3079_01755 [Clostridium sp. HMSC19C09]OFU22836.1 hypothetical protein HMPREF3077_08055 [Clostridium sp. HMSC19C05]OFU23351.1 hypothetical protein HMPREF3078_02120 [Clostridium sp. HMSC19C08]OFU26781.1 hypothetical protein HMPREF3075_16725 [Clostridium sp. H